MNDWGFDDIETSTQKRASLQQRCQKCQQLAIILTITTRKTDDITYRMKRCVSCGSEWWTTEVITTSPYMDHD